MVFIFQPDKTIGKKVEMALTQINKLVIDLVRFFSDGVLACYLIDSCMPYKAINKIRYYWIDGRVYTA